MTDAQKQVRSSANEIQALIDSMDEDNHGLQEQLDKFDTTIDPMDPERRLLLVEPGEKIGRLMEKWGEEPVYTDKDVMKWKDGYWISLAKFERELEDIERGYELFYQGKMAQLEGRMRSMKNKFMFQLEVYENALS